MTADRPLGPGRCGVWTSTLEAAPSEHDLRADLSADELARADRFRRSDDRARFVAGRAGLRRLLGHLLGRPAASLRFSCGGLGKPSLVREPGAPDLRFNVSHSGDLVAWAVALGRDVGVDVERVRADRVDDDVLQAALSPAETRRLSALSEADALGAFFACWTAKEAYAKALGDGLSVDFRRLDVLATLKRDGRVVLRSPGGDPSVTVGALPAPNGYRAASAHLGEPPGAVSDGDRGRVEPFDWRLLPPPHSAVPPSATPGVSVPERTSGLRYA